MIPEVKLNNGILLPSQGLGTYTITRKQMPIAIHSAYEAGCRLIDTASAYENEGLIGDAIKNLTNDNILKREKLFIQTKVGDKIDKNGYPIGYYFYNSPSCPNHDTKAVVFEQVENSLKQLKTDYIDLVLIHWPYNDVLIDIWKSLEELYEQKVIKSIGVSNCRKRHIEKILSKANICPMVNQININPLNTRMEDYLYCMENNIIIEAYSPLNSIRNIQFMRHTEIVNLTGKYYKSLTQILLRWFYQKEIVPITKSSNPQRIKDNYNIYDFSLSDSDIQLMDSANVNYQFLPESIFCPGY